MAAALDIRPTSSAGGYQGLRKALAMAPKEVTDGGEGLQPAGRGGAGFPTGMKWSFVPIGPDAPHPKYLVCNADEMEPGTFKDRLLLEGDPHQLVEGMVIAGYATEADVGYIFLRGEYTLAAERAAQAIAEAYAPGISGKNILGSGFSFELYLHLSAGRYMCGEETGLLNALEGKRANPRAKPPFPPVVGGSGKPTVVNNVETLCNVPHIVANGAEWFKRPEPHQGRRHQALRRQRQGEAARAVGTADGHDHPRDPGGARRRHARRPQLRGLLPGGASTDFLTAEHLDVAMDFTEVQKAGSRLGTGTMIVLDDKTCPVGMVWNLEHFFAQESCGWCTPCWSGLAWAERILLAHGRGRGPARRSRDSWTGIARFCAPGNTFCALAPGAAEPLQSGLKYFRDDFERHIRGQALPVEIAWRRSRWTASRTR